MLTIFQQAEYSFDLLFILEKTEQFITQEFFPNINNNTKISAKVVIALIFWNKDYYFSYK